MLESSQCTPRFVILEYCCLRMRFSEQNELYGGPTRWVTNKIGCFRGGCHSDLYRPNAEHFLFRFMRTSRRNAFRSLVRNSRYSTNASRDSASKLARRDRQHFDSATWLDKARVAPKEEFKQEVERASRVKMKR